MVEGKIKRITYFMMNKNYMIVSTEAEKAFDKINHL